MSSGDTHSQYNNHRREAELHDAPEHTHEVGVLHEKPYERKESHEQPRHGFEHRYESHYDGNFGHSEIAALAHQFWQARGCPQGSPEDDWSRAVKELRLRHQNVS